MTNMDHASNRGISGLIALLALLDCAVTGSWVAAFIAVAFGVVDCFLDRFLEILEDDLENED